MPKVKNLKITQFGNDVLRTVARPLDVDEINSKPIEDMIKNMDNLLTTKKLGVGLAAPQIDQSLAIAIIRIQKTALRPDVEPFSLTIINPVITSVFGRKSQMWEGCISGGAGKAGMFAKVPRYKKIEVEFYDERAIKRKEQFEGLPAHVIQHEVDHLNGVLFVDKVKDTRSYMTYSEYRKMKQRRNR